MYEADRFSEHHKAVAKAFNGSCFWVYKLHCALQAMSIYNFQHIHSHMGSMLFSLREYYLLQTCKLFDAKCFHGDMNRSNVTLAYVIDEFPWPDDVKYDLELTKSEMNKFYDHIHKERDKAVAHDDMKWALGNPERWSPLHSKHEEDIFVSSLLKLRNIIDVEVFGEEPIDEWPDFPTTDAENFMSILVKAKCAIKRN